MTATEQAFDLASERGKLEAMTMNAPSLKVLGAATDRSAGTTRARATASTWSGASSGCCRPQPVINLRRAEPRGARTRRGAGQRRARGGRRPRHAAPGARARGRGPQRRRDPRRAAPPPGPRDRAPVRELLFGARRCGSRCSRRLRVPSLRRGRAVRLSVGHRQGAKKKCWRLAHQRLPVLQAGEGGRMIKPRRWGSATASAASLENRAIPLAVRIRVDTVPA